MTQDNRYAKGKIYRLVNSVDGEEYVGSTCDTLPKRKCKHKDNAKKKPTRRIYEHLNAIGWDNVDIVLIEEYPCNNKMELERRERHFIEVLKPTLNKSIPTRTMKEYYTDNVDKIREYCQQNKDKIKERQRKYYQQNKDKINEKHREYRQQNKDKIKESTREYEQQNKDKIKERKREYRLRKKAEREAS